MGGFAETIGRNPWEMYDRLIDGVPEGIPVFDFCVGAHWCYVEASCGMGLSHALSGGAQARFKGDPIELDLRTLAALVKSWNFGDATLGVAALNAWYSTAEKVGALGGVIDREGWQSAACKEDDASANTERSGSEQSGKGEAANPFHADAELYAGKKVAVIGHFPNVASMAQSCELTVLERMCSSALDTPDTACEFILPEQDIVYMTGTTIINKTAPRLLQLCADARTSLVGPSSVPARLMSDYGVDCISGSVVTDPEQAKFAVKGGSKARWRAGIKKYMLQM